MCMMFLLFFPGYFLVQSPQVFACSIPVILPSSNTFCSFLNIKRATFKTNDASWNTQKIPTLIWHTSSWGLWKWITRFFSTGVSVASSSPQALDTFSKQQQGRASLIQYTCTMDQPMANRTLVLPPGCETAQLYWSVSILLLQRLSRKSVWARINCFYIKLSFSSTLCCKHKDEKSREQTGVLWF